jgi:cytidyltransferase-related domain
LTDEEKIKRLIKDIYMSKITGAEFSLKNEDKDLLLKNKLIDNYGNLTNEGREKIKVVLAGGVFDIIHPGHVYFLKKAKELGDVLVVVVARDVNVVRFKGVKPMHSENLRAELVGAIRYVDVSILGDENDLMKTVERVKPDIVALGYDQVHDEKWINSEAKKRGIMLQIVRLDSPYPNIKSRNIKNDPRFGWF